MVEPKRWVTGVAVVLAICLQTAICTPAPAEQQAAPPVGGTLEQVDGLGAGDGNAGSKDAESFNADSFNAEGYNAEGFNAEGFNAKGYNAEGFNAEGVDAEGRSCGNCGIAAPPLPVPIPDLGNFGLPDIFGKLSDKVQDIKLLTLIGLAIPILVLQIITLAIVAYLLKMVKSEGDTGTGSGTGGYYAAYPVQTSGGYKDSYSSYRSLEPSEDTMTWVLEKLSDAFDLYHDYQQNDNAI